MTIPSFFIKILRDYFRWVMLVTTLLFLGLGYGLFLSSRISTIQTISYTERTRAKNELKSAQDYKESLQISLDKFRSTFTTADLRRLKRVLPMIVEFPELMLTIKHMVEVNNLELSAITTNVVAAGTILSDSPNLSAIDINITVDNGTGYIQFKNFVATIESSEQLFDVRNLTFTKPEEDKLATETFTLRTYQLPEVKPIIEE